MGWASDVDWLNAALVLNNSEQAASLDEGSPTSVQAIPIMNLVASNIIARHPWRFARKRQFLSRREVAVHAPLYGKKYEFEIPSWIIGEPWLCLDASGEGVVSWTRADNLILSDEPQIILEAAYLAPVSNWPAHVMELMAHALAAPLAMAIPRDEALAVYHYRVAFGEETAKGDEGLLRSARQIDSKNEPAKKLKIRSEVLNVRSW